MVEEYFGIFWVGSGFLFWLTITIHERDKNFGSNPASGQLFIISLVLGVSMWFFALLMFIEEKNRNRNIKKVIDFLVNNKSCPKCNHSFIDDRNIFLTTNRYSNKLDSSVEYHCRDCDLEIDGRMKHTDLIEINKLLDNR